MQAVAVRKPKNSVVFRGEAGRTPTVTRNSGGATSLYYYGARYLDPRTSRWISADPAMGEYIPVAPINDQARKHNGNLPGMGGIFNLVNMHVYHYAGNNPIKLIDPDGRVLDKLTPTQWKDVKEAKDMAVQDLTHMIDALRFADSIGDRGALSPRMREGAEAFLGVDFSLPHDFRELADRLTIIRDSLENATIDDFRYDRNMDLRKFARYNSRSGKIELGDRFFRSSLTGNDTKQGTLVHETVHKMLGVNMPFRSSPFSWYEKYLMDYLQGLPVDPVNRRIRHANSWEYFYEYVNNGGVLKGWK